MKNNGFLIFLILVERSFIVSIEEKRKVKKMIFSSPEKKEKWLVCIRFPDDVRRKIKNQAKSDYKGRGKQSSLVEDAVKYYLYTCSKINWANYEKDEDYIELIDDINEGLVQGPLGNASQVFFSPETKNSILEIEKKIKLTRPLMKDVRTGLIRKAVSIRLSIGDKKFFDAIMNMDRLD
jgi:hypothetical protein